MLRETWPLALTAHLGSGHKHKTIKSDQGEQFIIRMIVRQAEVKVALDNQEILWLGLGVWLSGRVLSMYETLDSTPVPHQEEKKKPSRWIKVR